MVQPVRLKTPRLFVLFSMCIIIARPSHPGVVSLMGEMVHMTLSDLKLCL